MSGLVKDCPTAVRGLIANEFALKYRYAFTLHTDDPDPHVHLVVRAVSEQGQRLNIRTCPELST
jgi:hypothetical protein